MVAGIFDFVSHNVWTLAIDAVLTGLMLYPLAVFWTRGWQRRADEILGSLDDNAKRRYLAIFHKHDPNNTLTMSKDIAAKAFRDFYFDEYGRKRFVLPIAFLLLVAVVENFIFARALQALDPATFAVTPAAIAGAYTFVCWDLFARMQQKTFSRAGILRSALRLAVAVPIGVAFSSILPSYAVFVAFGVGAFPLQTISVLLQRQIKKYLSLETKETAVRDQVFMLAGIDTATAERIEDADITTITQLAWADPVSLTMRTNLQFAFVLDIIGQALAWVYLEEKLQKIGVVGLRGAVEIRQALEAIGRIDPNEDREDQDDVGPTGDHASFVMHEQVVTPDGVVDTDTYVEVISGEEEAEDEDESRAKNKAKDKKKAKDDEEEGEDEEAKAVRAAIDQAATLAGVKPDAMLYTFIQIGEDPTASFLRVSWDSLTAARPKREQDPHQPNRPR